MKRFLISGLCLFTFLLTVGAQVAICDTDQSSVEKRRTIENPYVDVPSAVKNMYHPDRFPDIYMIATPNSLFTSRSSYESNLAKGALGVPDSHGSTWNYDTDIPIVFYGKGIKKGFLGGEANLIDIAPTLAYLTGTQRPSAAKGRVLDEILEPQVAGWTGEDRPKVVVLFSLDQARQDYFNVFEDAFTFLKSSIIANGTSFARGRITHAKTATAVSHASVGTGSIPGLHGILGNNVIQPDGSFLLGIDDGNAGDFGHGNLSPHNILVPTLADELDRRYNNKSIIISSSSYARAAVGVAGHGAYYQDGDSFYAGADKDIVLAMNRYSGVPYTNTDYYLLPDYLTIDSAPDIHVKKWLKKYYGLDIETVQWTQDLTVTDSGPYSASENPVGHPSGTFGWNETYAFSHPIVNTGAEEPDALQRYGDYNPETTLLTKKYYETTQTPFFDLWNTDMNLMIMEKEGAGQDNVPDLAFFHIKSLDVVGHSYGVYSGEIHNYMYFADYMIKKVVGWLNKNVGEGNYTCVFFSDHGGNNVTNNGQWIITDDLIDALESKFGEGIVKKIEAGDQIWLDEEVLNASSSTTDDVVRWMKQNPDFGWLVNAYTAEEVSGMSSRREQIDAAYRNGYQDGIASSESSGSSCAAFDEASGKLHIPCIDTNDASYWMDLELRSQGQQAHFGILNSGKRSGD